MNGARLSQRYYAEVVRPILQDRWPRLPHAAARLGGGSDVLGLDDETSRDHDWGLRLHLLVPGDVVSQVDGHLARALPSRFAGHPSRFGITDDPTERHRVTVCDIATFSTDTLGLDATHELSVGDWLSLTGQGVLEVTAGPVFVDTTGELTALRRSLEWYPDDLWRHVVSVDWARLEQELPFVGRTGARGDDLGSRLLTARLAGVALHLAFLLERTWPPYAKWLGTAHADLPGTDPAALLRAVAAPSWQEREALLAQWLRRLADRQQEVGLPDVGDPVAPFHERPLLGIRPGVVELITDSITSPEVRSLARGVGTPEQWSDNVDVLLSPSRRARLR
ncbi:MAG: DUF4037 domain-containing protein [Terracoccus sp.]